eukprot:CAMPEP_0117000882 /NCGR_PEP_ID=MMETSP0472-20121206/3073_1 /TAXON_ID=693140 ORGANISM="Tiarina fusus, Strain LIS" /NCGR_SAMPLE_ID=MMETSP0472 /ASSEMBLY_ACC=CAM_ASM_000603 /LENGTH=407 /DNA_ID=CAMNT_0004700717 /DNA_START=62 /DNA_END=1285 /DNA_ORIENTATION=+
MEELPHRCIFNDVDMKAFMESSTKKELLSFVEAMGKSCTIGNARFDPSSPLDDLTPSMASLHGSLCQMIAWVDDFPPTNPELARFGNPAFRLWHGRLVERSTAIITSILLARDENLSVEEAAQRGRLAAAGELDTKEDASIRQVSCYLHDSFGHATRLDYGTGHESSFLVFLLVLSKVKCLGESPTPLSLRATALSIFSQYLQVTRKLQTDYRLEPAGSHGVWGLDDYHCLPFYFGACQLQSAGLESQELSSPKCVTDENVLKDYGDYYLYFSCIRYIRQLKQGVPFFESSPMLFDISQTLQTWDKVARGMLRLYQGEVLDKRQVVQHFVFSRFFAATWTPSQTERTAPSETFRNPVSSVLGMPPTRAPWAQAGVSASGMPETRAPWATKNETQEGDVPLTKAPWAK